MPTDLIVIGAGPAGMAAATTAAEAGLNVTLLDEQPRPGGQIYRDVARAAPLRGALLGKDYTRGQDLTRALVHPAITHIAGASVWSIEPGFTLCYSQHGKAAQVTGQRLLMATGALERPMPLPGWTLPGVMTAGAAQILLKQSGVVPTRAVLAGCGPLLYLIAVQMIRAGQPPLALVETQGRGDFVRAARHLGGALRGWRMLAKGAAMLAEIRRAGVPRYTGATGLSIEGDDHATAMLFTHRGTTHRIACDTVLLHHGVIPNTQASQSLHLPHRWNATQACFAPVVDLWGETALPGLFIAGDGAAIGGAQTAEIEGRLAALRIAQDLDALDLVKRDAQAAPLHRGRSREMAIRPFLDRAYPPFAQALLPDDSTLICRCEEITAGRIRATARQGCLGPDQAKAFTRCGMGPCQGRLCGPSVTQILAQANKRSPQETGSFSIRPPLKPVTLGEVAAMAPDFDSGPEG